MAKKTYYCSLRYYVKDLLTMVLLSLKGCFSAISEYFKQHAYLCLMPYLQKIFLNPGTSEKILTLGNFLFQLLS